MMHLTYTPSSEDIDAHGALRISGVLARMQQIAEADSSPLDGGYDNLQKRHLFWAALRTRILFVCLPDTDRDITLVTVSHGFDRMAAVRETTFTQGGRTLARAVSLWGLVDTAAHRLTRPPADLDAPFVPTEALIAMLPGKVIPRKEGQAFTRQATEKDIDRNGHVNNARYGDWVCDALAAAQVRDRAIKEFEINYCREIRLHEQVKLILSDESGASVISGYGPDGMPAFTARVLLSEPIHSQQ